MDKFLFSHANIHMKNIAKNLRFSVTNNKWLGLNLAYARDFGLKSLSGFTSKASTDEKKCHHRDAAVLRREIKGLKSLLRRSLSDARLPSRSTCTSGARLFSTSTERRGGEKRESDRRKKDKGSSESSGPEDFDQPINKSFAVLLGLLALAGLGRIARMLKLDVIEITWKEFEEELLLKGKVKEVFVIGPDPELDANDDRTVWKKKEKVVVVLHPSEKVNGIPVSRWKQYILEMPYKGSFEERMEALENQMGVPRSERMKVTHRSSFEVPSLLLRLERSVLMLSIIFGVVVLFRFSNISQGQGMDVRFDMRRKDGIKPMAVDAVKGITFKDVAGLQEAKQEVLEFVDYLKSPQRYKDLGAKIPKGALLLGPPGCGKTLLAKALAAESDVPFFNMAGSEFIEIIGGMGAQRVRNLFKAARKKTPCIIYIDEIDAIGRKRNENFESEEASQTLNQLLVEMDGMNTVEGVILFGSTNRVDLLDAALLRPGRFDRHITIDPPTYPERVELFNLYLKKIKLDQPATEIAGKLSLLTPGMSGADIKNICNEAAINAARKKMKHVTIADLDIAIERVVAGVEKKSSSLAPPEKKIVAYHEAGHALVGWMLEHTDALLKVTIVPRTSAALGFAQYKPSDQKLYSKEELFERMCMALGGRVSEAIIFNSVTTGAANDLESVRKMAYRQVKSYGMSDALGHLSFPDTSEEGQFMAKPYSKRMSALIDEEARALVGRAYQNTERVLTENKEKLQLLAKSLLERETLSYDDVQGLLGPPPFGKKKTIDIYPHFEGHIPKNGENGAPESEGSVSEQKFIERPSWRESFM